MNRRRGRSVPPPVAKGVRRLMRGVANFYLIDQAGRLTLVDAGTPGDWGLFQRALSDMGRQPEDLDAVVLTHAHADHAFAEKARSQIGSPVWIHHAGAIVAKGAKPDKNHAGMARYLTGVESYRTVISLTRRKGAKIVPIVEVTSFDDRRDPRRSRQTDSRPRPRAHSRGVVFEHHETPSGVRPCCDGRVGVARAAAVVAVWKVLVAGDWSAPVCRAGRDAAGTCGEQAERAPRGVERVACER